MRTKVASTEFSSSGQFGEIAMLNNHYLQVSISSTFYVQLLRMQIPNAQKRQSSQQCRLALLGPTGIKAVRRTLMKLTPCQVF